MENEVKSITVTPESDIVAARVELLREELFEKIDESPSTLTIDFENVTLIDSSGVGVLISARNALRREKGDLRIVNVAPDIMYTFKVMRLDKHFTIVKKGDGV